MKKPQFKVVVTREEFLRTPFIDLEALIDSLEKRSDLQDIRQQLEALSVRAGMIAAYLDEREGYGCGDQGHANALKAMNRAGKIIHCKAFGYNAFNDVNF